MLYNSWFVCESILRLLITIIVYLTYFIWESNLPIDSDDPDSENLEVCTLFLLKLNFQNLGLFLLETFVLYYTSVKTYYSFKRAKYGLFNYSKPCLVCIEICFSKPFVYKILITRLLDLICVIGAVVLTKIGEKSEILVLEKSSIWFAFLDVSFVTKYLIYCLGALYIKSFHYCCCSKKREFQKL